MDKEQFIEEFKSEFIDADTIIIDGTTKFREIGSWDSLTGMAILVMIQDKYNKNFNEEAFKKCLTVDEVYSSVQSN